jgi:hypothetical protein
MARMGSAGAHACRGLGKCRDLDSRQAVLAQPPQEHVHVHVHIHVHTRREKERTGQQVCGGTMPRLPRRPARLQASELVVGLRAAQKAFPPPPPCLLPQAAQGSGLVLVAKAELERVGDGGCGLLRRRLKPWPHGGVARDSARSTRTLQLRKRMESAISMQPTATQGERRSPSRTGPGHEVSMGLLSGGGGAVRVDRRPPYQCGRTSRRC